MFNQAKLFFLALVTASIYSSGATAAIFEMQHALAVTSASAASIHPFSRRVEGLYHAGPVDHGGDLQFRTVKTGVTRPVELLWEASGDTSFPGPQPLPWNADTPLYPVEAEHLLTQKTGYGNSVRSQSEGTAPETWAVILIGAGLVWSQLRRKSRHSAIRFTAP